MNRGLNVLNDVSNKNTTKRKSSELAEDTVIDDDNNLNTACSKGTPSKLKAKKTNKVGKVINFDKEEALLKEVELRTPLYVKSNDIELISEDNINRLWGEVAEALKPKCKLKIIINYKS